MSYQANYDTALTYINAGLIDRAYEALSKALKDVPESDKVQDNVVYLRTLSLLGKLSMEKNRKDEAMRYVEEGLSVRSDHPDLLFLRILYLWDQERFDEMFGSLISYLITFLSPEQKKYGCEFIGQGAVDEVFKTLLPVSYRSSVSNKETIDVIRRLSEKTQNEIIRRAYEMMVEIDAKRESEA